MKMLFLKCMAAYALLTFGISGFTVPAQDKPKEPAQEKAPALTIEQKEAIEALQNQSLKLYIQMTAIQKRFEDALKADPEYSALSKQNEEVSKKMKDIVADVNKNIDKTKWQLDFNDFTFKPVPQASAPAETKKP